MLHSTVGDSPRRRHKVSTTNAVRYGFVGILIEDREASAGAVQDVLSRHGSLIRGRLGLPGIDGQNLSVITLVIRATSDELGSLTGQLGRIAGVSVKSAMSKHAYA